MVCAKCEKKLAKSSSLACTDVWRPTGSAGDRNTTRKVGENKLLGAKARYSPYAPGGSKAGASASSSKAGGTVTFGKCETCKVTVSRVGAKYCQGCAYKKGCCAICTKQILDTTGYKMSSK